MKKLLILCSVIILLSTFGYGQSFTTVTGTTITDSGGQVWSNMTVVANLIPPNGSSLGLLRNQGFSIGDTPQYVLANSSGTFSIVLDDNTKVTPGGSFWRLSLCSNTSSICSTLDIPISGGSMNITSQVQNAIKNPAPNSTTTITRGYNVNEVTGGNGSLFWRTTDNTLWGCQTTPNSSCPPGWIQVGSVTNPLPTASSKGQIIVSTAPGQTYIAENQKSVDARDIGVDCTGASDSSTALNALSLNNVELDFPSFCQVRLNNTWNIFGASSFYIKGLGNQPNQGSTTTPMIFGCGASGTPLIYINRSQYGRIEGLGLYAKGSSCSSTFTTPLQYDNNGGGGLNSHDLIIAYNAISSSPTGGAISNFNGILVGPNGANLESVDIHNNWIHAQNSSSSICINIAVSTSDSDEAHFNDIQSCKYGIQNVGNIRILNNLFSNVGRADAFGEFGAAIYTPACSSGQLYIAFNEHDGGGPFFDNDHTGVNGCQSGINFINNVIGIDSMTSGDFPIDVGNTGASYIFIGNTVVLTTNFAQYTVGSKAQPVLKGPLGTEVEFGNNIVNGGNTLGWEDITRPFQAGEDRKSALDPSIETGPNGTARFTTSKSQMLVPNLIGNSFIQQSPYLGLRSWTSGASDDWLAQASASNTISSMTFGHIVGGASTLWFNWDGLNSGLNLAQLPTPAPPTGVTPVGTPGGTTYTYALVGYGQTGNTIGSTTLSTTTGNATLNSSNYNQVGTTPGIDGASKWCVWRTVGGPTQGKIGCISKIAANISGANSGSFNNNQYFLNDIGLVGDGTPLPTQNSTGMLNIGNTPYLFANLPAVANGMLVFCSDCKNNADNGVAWDSAAVGGGNGCMVLRENNAWRVR